MKIGEFAERNQVTTKMLRHYDVMGLLKPALTDPVTGYRSYEPEQSHVLNWIIILKNLDFTLAQIKEMLSGPMDSADMIRRLVRKRIEITAAMNEQQQKKIAIDRLIRILEKEGFHMEKQIHLLSMNQESVHEVKKNIPNMEMFLEAAAGIASLCGEDETVAVFRFDISHFKQVNDEFGFDVGDHVIVACYKIIESCVGRLLEHAAIGRAHGDEFIVFARAGKAAAEQAAQAIVEGMRSFDFPGIGCHKQMGCYIGGGISRQKALGDIRQMIEESIETINHARSKGRFSVVIEAYA